MNIKEIALKVVVDTVNKLYDSTASYSELTEEDKKFYWTFAEAPIAELAKQNEPIYQFLPDGDNWIDCGKQFFERWRGEKRIVYTFPPTAEQIANETAEACARYVNRFINGDGILNEVWISEIEEALRSGAWKGFKK